MSKNMSQAERKAWVKSWNGNPPPFDDSSDTPGGTDPQHSADELEAAQAEVERLRALVAEISPGSEAAAAPQEIDFPEGGGPDVTPVAGSDDYDDWRKAELAQEIEERNEGRDDDSKIDGSGLKDDLIAAIRADDLENKR